MNVVDVSLNRLSNKPTSLQEEELMFAHYTKMKEADEHNMRELAAMDKSHIKKKSLIALVKALPDRLRKEHIKHAKWYAYQSKLVDYKRFHYSGLERTWLKGAL